MFGFEFAGLARERERKKYFAFGFRMECWLWAEKVHGTADVAIEELSLPIIGEGVSSCIIRERDLDCWVGCEFRMQCWLLAQKVHGTTDVTIENQVCISLETESVLLSLERESGSS